jgi:hypothetical protein
MTADPLRIANASGFYGDRASAMYEQLSGGEIDVLTGDYLAELTMLILGRDRLKDASLGYAKTFLRQLESTLGIALDNGVKIVANAGGLNPAGLAAAVRMLADDLGLEVAVAHVEGDDLRARAGELGLGEPLAANAYLGAWGIADCLRAGADIVVTGRVTDASLVVGPAAAHFGWTARWPPGTSSNAARRRPAATTPSSPSCPRGTSRSASRSRRCTPTGPASSPSTRAPAARSPSARLPHSCSTKSAARATRARTSPHASTRSNSARAGRTASASPACAANRRRPR